MGVNAVNIIEANALGSEQKGLWSSKAEVPEKAMAPHSSTLAWKIHAWRSLVGCSPRSH